MDKQLKGVKNVSEAKLLFAQLERDEAVLREELDLLLDQQSLMDVKMTAFQKMLPGMRNLNRDTQEINAVVTKASTLAESVRSKVRVLDVAKSRVYASLKRVDDVIDLKSCVDGVQRAMDAGDYEQAAGHIHRYLALDESVLMDTTTDLAKGSSSTVSVSFGLLRETEARLKDLVRSKFAEASSHSDASSLERFLKVFPLLNLHEEGLKMLNGHLSQLVRDGSQKNLHVAAEAKGDRAGVVYADTLTLLYEGIARLIESYQPLVETYYGPVWVPELLRHLQLQCDEQVVLIVDQLRDERHLNHKVQTVTIAMNARSAAGAIRPNILELDTLLTELSLCSKRTELYFTFLARKIGGLQTEDRCSGEEILKNCRTKMVIQELIATYIPIEHYFLRESMNKAVSLDVCNADGLTSSMADDVFFVLQKSIRRALSSCSVDGACAMLNHASSLLLTEYKTVLQSKLKIASSSGLDLQSMLQGRLQARPSSLSNIDANKVDSLITLNNIEIVIGNIDTLAKELQTECSKLFSQSGDPRANKLEPCLADLSSANTTFKQMKESGMSKLVEICVVPRLKVCTDVIPTVSHVLSEEDLVNFEVNDPFVQQLISCLEGVLNELKGSLLVQVFGQVVIDVAGELALLLEAQLFKCTFNQLGGVQLDRELRALIAYISSMTQWPVRDKFSRLQQVVTILTLETLSEILDYWGSNAGPMIWRLSTLEVRRVLHLRVDFKADDVDRIKL